MRIAETNTIAAFLKCHRNTVLKMAKEGILPSFRIGVDLRFDLDAVESWAKAQMKSNQAAALNKPPDTLPPTGKRPRGRPPMRKILSGAGTQE